MRHSDKSAVTVNVTNQCNLRCEYCMAASGKEQTNPIVISMPFAKAGIADALRGYPTGIPSKILRFFSPGEPTQKIEIMHECVDYARSITPNIKTELQTNGLFCTELDTEWIAKNFDAVWFSLDGPATINDKHRYDQFYAGHTKEIENNLKHVAQFAFVGVRSTVVEETLDHQEDLVDYYWKLGVGYLGLNPVIRPIERQSDGATEVTMCDIMRFAKGFLRAYQRGRDLGVKVLSSLTFNFDEATDCSCRSCLPVPQLNPDGSVSSCDMALYRDTKKELQCFIYGIWSDDEKRIVYDENRIHYLKQRRLGNLAKCRNCKIGRFCAGGCAGRIAYQTGDIFDIIPEYCAATLFLADHIPFGKCELEYTHP